MRLAVTCLACWLASPTAAQPVVHVRAETRIELRTDREGDGVVVRGVLRDDLGGALPRRQVRLRIVDESGVAVLAESVATDANGSFEARAPLEAGSYRASARFAGDESHERLLVERVIDLERAEVRLVVRVPEGGRLDLDVEDHMIEVRARCEVGVSGLHVELLDELDRPLARGITDDEGRTRFPVASSALAAPGPGRLKARTSGDALRADAQTEVPIVRQRRTVLTLETEGRTARIGDALTFRGSLRDSQGPLAERAIGLFTEDTHRGTVLTDDRGAFVWEHRVERDDVPRLALHARFESDGPGRVGSRSEVVTIGARADGSSKWAWSLLPLALCAVVLLLLRRREGRTVPVPPPPRARPGVVRAAPARRRAVSRLFGGRLVDHRDDDAIVGTLALEGPSSATVHVPADGFSMELADGEWTATFHAPGHAPVSESLRVPHHGEWDRVEVRLESWRHRALGVFRRWIERWGPERRWSRRTLQELRRDLPPPAQELGADVEQAFYGPLPPDGARVADLESRAEEIAPSVRQRQER